MNRIVGRQWAKDSPLLRQLLFVVPIIISVFIVAGWGTLTGSPLYYWLGLCVVLVATIAVCVLPRTPSGWLLALVPGLDLVGLGLMRLSNEGDGIGLMVVLPALWLGWDLLGRGVAITVILTLVAFSVPTLIEVGTGPITWSRTVLMALVTTTCALSGALLKQAWLVNQRALLEHEVELEHQREVLREQRHELRRSVRAERAVIRNQQAIAEAVDVGLLLIDKDGTYLTTNPRHREFLAIAYPTGHLGTAGQLGFVYGPDRTTPLTEDRMPTTRAKNGETYFDTVMWIGDPEVKQLALAVSASPILDPDGTQSGSVLVYKDVTELLSAVQAREDFVAAVSHELRTPLTSIVGFSDLISSSPGMSEATAGHLQIIQRNSRRLLRLVGDLLQTAQADKGHLSVHRELTDLSALISAAVAERCQEARGLQVGLACEIESGVEALIDGGRVRQLIDNFISNALKYTPAGGQVCVQLTSTGDEVQMSVSDTGIGINEAELGSIFDRFVRTKEASSGAVQGLGLGLAISKAITEAHRGHITVQSTLSQGTVFTVTLPRLGAYVS